jgi:uncharacterized phiE125 gp8 family phage protein
MSYIQTAKTNADIVTLEDTMSFMRVTERSEDTMIQSMIDSAVEMAESFMRRDILTTTWEGYFDTFYTDLTLERAKFQSVEAVDYLVSGTYTTLAASEYTVKKGGIYGQICELNDPGDVEDTFDSIRITFKTGWGDTAESVPSSLKLAIQNMTLYIYENRGDCSCIDDFPEHIIRALGQYKVIPISGGADNIACL